MELEMKKISLLLFVSIVLFACSLSDVDDESDFIPTYDKLVGCWVSTENVVYIDSLWGDVIKEEPFSSCREMCFREDSSFTLRIKISKNTTTTFRDKDSSSVVTVNDSIVEAYDIKNDVFYGGEFKLSISYWRGNFENAILYDSWNNGMLPYHRSLQHDNCGNFGRYIDTTKYTLDSLRGK